MEPTQKLVLYCPPGWGGVFMDLAKYQYGAQYPDVEVEYRTFTQGGESWITNAHGARGPNPEMTEDFNQALLAELNAGKGPDAVVFFSDTFPDLDKVLEAGVFCDLEPLFEQDETFDRAEYLTALLLSLIHICTSSAWRVRSWIMPIRTSRYMWTFPAVDRTCVRRQSIARAA